jgi:chorismate mutase
MSFPSFLTRNSINLNSKLKDIYLQEILPSICLDKGDDGNYGSSATKDIEALQLLSRRIHFGKFVAEAKFRDPRWHGQFVKLIKAKDEQGIMDLLTHRQVEERLLKRVQKKALFYGQEYDDDGNPSIPIEPDESSTADYSLLKIQPEIASQIYSKFIIPLTKEVELEYLLDRLNHPY